MLRNNRLYELQPQDAMTFIIYIQNCPDKFVFIEIQNAGLNALLNISKAKLDDY